MFMGIGACAGGKISGKSGLDLGTGLGLIADVVLLVITALVIGILAKQSLIPGLDPNSLGSNVLAYGGGGYALSLVGLVLTAVANEKYKTPSTD